MVDLSFEGGKETEDVSRLTVTYVWDGDDQHPAAGTFKYLLRLGSVDFRSSLKFHPLIRSLDLVGKAFDSDLLYHDEHFELQGYHPFEFSMGAVVNLGEQGARTPISQKSAKLIGATHHFSEAAFPNALRLYRSGLVIPLYGKLEESDIDYVADSMIRSL